MKSSKLLIAALILGAAGQTSTIGPWSPTVTKKKEYRPEIGGSKSTKRRSKVKASRKANLKNKKR